VGHFAAYRDSQARFQFFRSSALTRRDVRNELQTRSVAFERISGTLLASK
jgi:hypothetical protein